MGSYYDPIDLPIGQSVRKVSVEEVRQAQEEIQGLWLLGEASGVKLTEASEELIDAILSWYALHHAVRMKLLCYNCKRVIEIQVVKPPESLILRWCPACGERATRHVVQE